MTWTATVKFAPLVSVERVNDPAWARGDRTMVSGINAYRLPPGKTSIPLICDHDFDCELGTIRDWFRLRWIDGDWLAATATLHAPPPPFLHRGARVSHGYKPLHRHAVFFGRPENQVIALALLVGSVRADLGVYAVGAASRSAQRPRIRACRAPARN